MGLRFASTAVAALLLATSASAFVAPCLRSTTPPSTSSARHLGVDPSLFHDLPHHLTHAFNTFNLADDSAVVAASDVVNEVVKKDAGWFGFLTEPIALLLQAIHSGLGAAGMSANSWGVSIVTLTVLIKLATFPLTKTQLESTNKMQVRT